MATLSVVLIVRNGGADLIRALESCQNIVKQIDTEIILVDDFSSDNTLEIAKRFGAKTFQRHLNNDFAGQTNFALEQASGKWVFILDHDEVVTPLLASSIIKAVLTEPLKECVYLVKRVNCFKHLRLSHGVFRSSWFKRLFPRENAYYQGKVHQTLICPYQKTQKLAGHLDHYTISNLPAYWQKQAFYAGLFAEKKVASSSSSCPAKITIILKTLAAFLQSYVMWLGFLDGFWGWYFSLQFAIYTANRYSQIYALKHQLGHEL